MTFGPSLNPYIALLREKRGQMPGMLAAIQNGGSAKTSAKASKPEASAVQKPEQSFLAAPG